MKKCQSKIESFVWDILSLCHSKETHNPTSFCCNLKCLKFGIYIWEKRRHDQHIWLLSKPIFTNTQKQTKAAKNKQESGYGYVWDLHFIIQITDLSSLLQDTHTHTPSHTHTPTLSLTHTHPHTHTHTLSLTHTYTHTHSLSLSLSHTHIHHLANCFWYHFVRIAHMKWKRKRKRIVLIMCNVELLSKVIA